jgi:transcriptional regulator with XRE-family HTH domain
MSTGALIKRARLALELSEQAFADQVGVTRGAVQQWERGKTAPKRAHQQAVAQALGVTVGELMEGKSLLYPEDGQPMSFGDVSFSVAEPDPPRYDLGIVIEVRNLIEQMSAEGQAEAVSYLRYLVTRFPKDKG